MSRDPSRPARQGTAIADYRPEDGDHLCSLWTDPPTDRLAARRFLLGAGPGEASLAILDPSRDADPRAAGIAAGLAAERVELLSTDQAHVDGGAFDPERMRRFWAARAAGARAAGRRHLRAVAEMAWQVRGLPGTGEAPLFESSLTPLFSSFPASVLCQYGSTRFTAETVLAMALSHPLVVIGEAVFPNPFHVAHERFAERFEGLRRDPAAALVPAWAYFLRAQPSRAAVGAFLCNSLPTLIGAEQVVVALRGLPSPLALEVDRDRVEPADEGRCRAARAAGRRSRVLAEGPWGTVRAGRAYGAGALTACLAGGEGTVTAARDGGFPDLDQARFVPLAWDLASALRAAPLPG